MNYGLYLSATGVLTNMHRQDVIANNLANASTVGFKGDLAAFTQRLPEAQENPADPDLAQQMLDRLGGGLFVRPTEMDRRTGPLERTNNALDLAIEGPGFFTVYETANGEQTTRLTRDGRLSINANGQLITVVGGRPVLNLDGEPIQVDPSAQLAFDADGTVRQDGNAIAQIRMIDVPADARLRHLGAGLYEGPARLIEEGGQDNVPTTSRVVQGAVEGSNIDPIRAMVDMIETTRAISMNGRLIRYQDSTVDRAVNTFGRVA